MKTLDSYIPDWLNNIIYKVILHINVWSAKRLFRIVLIYPRSEDHAKVVIQAWSRADLDRFVSKYYHQEIASGRDGEGRTD